MNLELLKRLPQNSTKNGNQSPVKLLNSNIRTLRRSLMACQKVTLAYKDLLIGQGQISEILKAEIRQLNASTPLMRDSLYRDLSEDMSVNKAIGREGKIKL